MEIVGIFNTISFILILLVVITLLWKFYGYYRADGSIILVIISFCVLLFVTFTNVLEHMGFSTYFDLFEDEVEIVFIPLFIFAVFSYCLRKELQENTKKEKSIKETNFRLYTSVKGASQALWEYNLNNKSIIIKKDYCFLDFDLLYYKINEDNWKDIIHPDSESAYKILLSSIESGSVLPENTELQLSTYYGNYRWVLIRGAKSDLNFENNQITYSGTLIDIGNFKNVQFELENARLKAEESEKLKSAFLNNISHEIRTPMNAIVGFSDLIIEPGITPDKQKKYMSMIVEGCERLIQIIEDLIEMSQIIAGIVQINKKPIHTDDFCSKLIDKYSLKATSKNLKLQANYDPSLIFFSDETKLSKILCNLLDNSVKFTNSGFIEFGINASDEILNFYVKDSGIGIAKEYQETIFEYFRQIETSLSKFHSGSGLGLSISKGLVDVLDGKISIDSKPGIGTTVFFSIPHIKSSDIITKSTLKTKIPGLKMNAKVLIAEDEESNYMYLNELLISKIDKIFWAQNGEEAVKLFKNNRDITLVLMDIKMPVLDGCEAAEQIKKIDPSVPIIAQTAYSMLQNSGCTNKDLFVSYITKPINRETVNCIIDQYLV